MSDPTIENQLSRVYKQFIHSVSYSLHAKDIILETEIMDLGRDLKRCGLVSNTALVSMQYEDCSVCGDSIHLSQHMNHKRIYHREFEPTIEAIYTQYGVDKLDDVIVSDFCQCADGDCDDYEFVDWYHNNYKPSPDIQDEPMNEDAGLDEHYESKSDLSHYP